MAKRYKVVRPSLFAYGTMNKAWICMNKGQIWNLIGSPSKHFKWYSLWRNGVTIDVVEDDFKRIFEPIVESEVQE